MNRAFLFALLALVAVSSFAQSEPSADDLQRQIRELQQKLDSIQTANTSTDLTELRRQIDVLTREIESLRIQQEPPRITVAQYGLGPAASKVYNTESGLSIGGYGEVLYEAFDSQRDSGVASGSRDQLDMLRAILYTGYKFNDRVVLNTEIEFEHAVADGSSGGLVAVEFAYLDFLLTPAANVRAGLMLMPMGIVNELHEPTAFHSAKRPYVERFIIPSTWREAGVGLFGDVGQFSYRTAIVTGLDADDFSNSGIRSGRQGGATAKAEDWALTGRLDWKPIEGTMFGGAVYSGNSGQNQRTPTGETFEGNVTIYQLHADAQLRGLSLRGLWAQGEIGDVEEINRFNNLTGNASVGEEFAGWYAEAGYDVAQHFSRGNFSLTPFVRFESYDTQKEVPTGFSRRASNDTDVMTVGVSFKPIPQAAIKIDFSDFEKGDDSGVDQYSVALGYIF
jgi:hypothetical protein